MQRFQNFKLNAKYLLEIKTCLKGAYRSSFNISKWSSHHKMALILEPTEQIPIEQGHHAELKQIRQNFKITNNSGIYSWDLWVAATLNCLER